MASFPSDLPQTGFDDASSNPVAAQRVSRFWLYYWLLAVGAGVLGITLAIAQVKNDAVGLLILLSLAMLVLGLIPCLVMTVERQVARSLSRRLPDYEHRWSTGARWWLGFHVVVLIIMVLVIIGASLMPARKGKEVFIVLATFLGVTYFVMIAVVLSWRERRKRMAQLAGLEELQSFELVLDNEDAFQHVEPALPILGGKQKGRCFYRLEGQVADWRVQLFDWLDINKQPPRREWITIALVQLQRTVPMLHLQPTERMAGTQLHWWHIFLEFPFGLIIFLVSATAHYVGKLGSKPALSILHTPALTKGYQMDAILPGGIQTLLTPAMCQEIMKLVHQKKRFLMVNQQWLLLAGHKKEVSPRNLGELVADALRLASLMEDALDPEVLPSTSN